MEENSSLLVTLKQLAMLTVFMFCCFECYSFKYWIYAKFQTRMKAVILLPYFTFIKNTHSTLQWKKTIILYSIISS